MYGFNDDFPYVPAFQAVDLETDQDMAVTLGMPWPSTEQWELVPQELVPQFQEPDVLIASHPTLVSTLPPAENSNAEKFDYTDGVCFRPDEPFDSPLYCIDNGVDSSVGPQQDVETWILYEDGKRGSGSAHDVPASHPDTSGYVFWNLQGRVGSTPESCEQKPPVCPVDETATDTTTSHCVVSGWPEISHESQRPSLELSASAPELTEFRGPLFPRQSVATRKSLARLPEAPLIVKVEYSDVDALTKADYSSQGSSRKNASQKAPKVSRTISDRVHVDEVGLEGIPARWIRVSEQGEQEELASSISEQVAEVKCEHAGTSNIGKSLSTSEKPSKCGDKERGEVTAVRDVGKLRSKAVSAVHQKKAGGNTSSQTNGEVDGKGKTLNAEQHRFLDQFLDSIIADSVERTEERFRESLNSYQRQSQLRAGVVAFGSRSGGGPNRVWPETLR